MSVPLDKVSCTVLKQSSCSLLPVMLSNGIDKMLIQHTYGEKSIVNQGGHPVTYVVTDKTKNIPSKNILNNSMLLKFSTNIFHANL